MSQLQDRVASMVHAFDDQERKAAVRALAQDVGALEDRLAELERELEQAKDDEAWAHLHAVALVRRGDGWVAEHFDGSQVRDAEAPTIAAVLRDLRAKVEGGAK